jgi:hypothetical protein
MFTSYQFDIVCRMNKNTYINIQKEKYYKIIAVKCRCLSNELVFFNNYGLNHILRKDNKDRPFQDQFRRFSLMKYCKIVLQKEDVEVEYRVSSKISSTAHFWGITGVVNRQKIKIVIRRINKGQLIFLSIMNG